MNTGERFWSKVLRSHDVECGCEVGRCLAGQPAFVRFSGTTVTESSYVRRCACGRMIGRRGKSYCYGARRQEDVCRRCHRRNFRRWRARYTEGVASISREATPREVALGMVFNDVPTSPHSHRKITPVT